MGSLKDEDLLQMVSEFIESGSHDSSKPISSSNKTKLHETTYHKLQEILRAGTLNKAVLEILKKISSYYSMIRNDDHHHGDESVSISDVNKWVVLRLMTDGYEASLCRPISSFVSTMDHFTAAGYSHEYVEVITADQSNEARRVIVDMDFRSQFEVARPTSSFKKLTESLPVIFVGTEEKLHEIISLVCSAAKKSLKEKGLHVPPWRKASYMHSKWSSNHCT